MVGRVATLCAALGLMWGAAFAAVPRDAGLSAGVLGDWDKVLDLYPATSSERAHAYFRALALFETGRTRDALALFGELSSAKGAFSSAAMEKLVELAFDLARYEEVVKILQEGAPAKLVDPDSFHYRWGQSLMLLGRYEEAGKVLARVQGARWRPYARHSLALVSFAMQDVGSAIEYLGDALDASARHPDRGVRRALIDRLRLLRGRMILDAAVAANALDPVQKEKLLKVAVSQLSLLKEESPLYPEALRTLGWCALEMGDTPRALAQFELASSVDPDNAHEDRWATGRVLERLGYYDEAATAYAQAREMSLKTSDALLERSGKAFEQTPPPRGAWVVHFARIARLREAAQGLEARRDLAVEAAAHRLGRQEKAGAVLESVSARIQDFGREIDEMDKGLYRHLDLIPARSLFPKAERGRIDNVLNRQEFLLADIQKAQGELIGLERTRAWTRASSERLDRAEALWRRLHLASAKLSKGQLDFMESMKRRVTVRERELVRLVDARRQEHASVRDALTETRAVLQADRDRLGLFSKRIEALGKRMEAVRAKVDALEAGARKAVEAESRGSIARRAERIRKRGDEFALDEAQALHLLQEPAARQPGGGRK